MLAIQKLAQIVILVRVSSPVTTMAQIKFKTIIGDDVFVGSDTQLVAPVKVANGATIGAGTTITRDVSENELVITRVPQRHIQDWQRPTKKKIK